MPCIVQFYLEHSFPDYMKTAVLNFPRHYCLLYVNFMGELLYRLLNILPGSFDCMFVFISHFVVAD